MQSLNQMLDNLANSDMLPMHMPGHKRNTDLCGTAFDYRRDITEITGFDNLHDMQGVLRQQAKEWARLYGANTAFMSTNGSTCCILAAWQALLPLGGEVIMDRASHRAMYHAAYLTRSQVHYLQQNQLGSGILLGVIPEQVEQLLNKYPATQLVCITTPSYEGVISDVAAIAKVCHRAGAKLFVDAAHGAHCCLPTGLKSPIALGADVACVSLHKTLPSPTGTALLLGGRGVNAADLQRGFDIFETSSPSYILLAAMERCQQLILSQGEQLAAEYRQNIRQFYTSGAKLKHLQLLGMQNPPVYGLDLGKIVVDTTRSGITGSQLAHCLREEYHIECEMAMEQYCLCMSSICDTATSFDRLLQALLQIDQGLCPAPACPAIKAALPPRVAEPWQVVNATSTVVPPDQAVGRVSLAYVWAYPPGVPWLVPGEQITADIVAKCMEANLCGVALHATAGQPPVEFAVADTPQKNIDGTGKS